MPRELLRPGFSNGLDRSEMRVRPCTTQRRSYVLTVVIFICANAGALANTVTSELHGAIPTAATTKSDEPALDELIFRDGDRIRGHLLKRAGDTLLFQSERFGLLKVPAGQAEVILAKSPSIPSVKAATLTTTGDVAVERAPFSPLAMTRALKAFFGDWHGRFNLGAEVLQDVSDRTSTTVEARLERKWSSDEVKINGRYDYAAVNQIVATDLIKAGAEWRHDFSGRFFSVYRPTVEWNRAFYRGGQPADYVLLQQEAGAGINVLKTDTRRFRVGLSENAFDTWVTPVQSHSAQMVESLFTELEAKLPWWITLTNRAVWYHSFDDKSNGWEDRFEVSKKLTETLTIGAQHETRYNNPDVRSADYQRHRLVFGFDF